MFDYSNYNKDQREAVLHEDGPVMIIAGAGTGKTNVLTGRILRLMLEKKVSGSQILALTFTEKATLEMTERVQNLLPLGSAAPWIKTFHGFCDTILRERGIDMGLSPDYELLSEAHQWILFRKNIFQFALDYYRPLNSPSKFIHALISHISRLKDEAVSPNAYIDFAVRQTAAAKTDEMKLEAKRMLEAAQAYMQYQKLLRKQNCLDYGDLILLTLELFEKRPNVLAEYQTQFQHILVDEFQDTNFAQLKLVMMLTRKHKNLFVVGDDDQSIYKWRGASVANIAAFEKEFPKAKKIVLTKNYRNGQKILDISYHVIRVNNPNRLEYQAGVSKKLTAEKSVRSSVEVRQFSHYLYEMDFIADTIEKLKPNERDVAVLVRANQHAKAFVEIFKQREIPYQYFAEGSLFTRPEIKDVLSLLRFLNNFRDDASLFRIFSLPAFGIPAEDFTGYLHEARQRYRSVFEHLRMQSTINQKMENVINILATLLEYSKNHSVSEVLGKFFELSEYIKQLVRNDTPESDGKLKSLADFSLLVRNFEMQRGEHNIGDFMEYMDLLQEAGERNFQPADIDHSIPKILTLHAAKGLEFDSVFIPYLVQGKFPSITRKDPIEIPEGLLEEELPADDLHLEEERRLFYVGCTRAKKNLFLTASELYEGTKRFQSSPFLTEAMKSLGTKTKKSESPKKPAILLPQSSEKRAHRVIHPWTVKVEKLSYSQFDVFRTCPLKYKFRYLFQIPSPTPAVANFGSSVHNTLKLFYQALKTGAKADPAMLEKLYRESWIPFGYENKVHEESRKEQGLEMMKRFYEKNSDPWILPAFIEKSFRLSFGKIGVEGRIDRIDRLEDGTYEVIDYKTGKTKTKSDLTKDLQLSLYALACRDALKLPVTKLSLYFIEDNVKLSTMRTTDDLNAVQEEMTTLAEVLRTSDFSATPGFHCSWCEYRPICDAATEGVRM